MRSLSCTDLECFVRSYHNPNNVESNPITERRARNKLCGTPGERAHAADGWRETGQNRAARPLRGLRGGDGRGTGGDGSGTRRSQGEPGAQN